MENSSGASRLMPGIYRDGTFRHWLTVCAVAFAVLSVGSFAAGLLMPEVSEKIYRIMSESAQSAGLQNEAGGINVLALFLHNLRSMVFTVLYGVIPFFYLPALLLGLNAFSLGFVGAYCVRHGMSVFAYLAGVLPHGVFELSALVLGICCGFYLCDAVTRRLRLKAKGIVLEAIYRIGQLLILHVTPLLLIAAFVEAYITPSILNLFV